MKGLARTLVAWLTCSTMAAAWQLQPLSLEERIRLSDVIVAARVTEVVRSALSEIGGVGRCHTARLRVSRVLKGEAPDDITAAWCDVTQAEGANPLHEESVWLLQSLPDGTYQVRGSFAGVLPAASVKLVEGLQAVDMIKR